MKSVVLIRRLVLAENMGDREMKICRRYVMIAAACLVIVSPLALGLALTAAGPKKPVAKNIIVMISDGWGFNRLEAASYYGYGKDARQIFNRFPFNYAMSTYMAYDAGPCYGQGYDPELAWSDFDYVKDCYTDSAAAATAMSTGVKTYIG
jgi:alkaline phosphatase